jgi:ribosomal protein S18 acetylase RimI-like enzyme
VHRDAFAPSRMTAAKHRAVMAAPTYRQDLDLVVEAPDGSLAAFSIVWFDEVNGIGVFEPVGTHSAHRRLGLGAAVMREGMRRLQALGAHTAYVNTGGHTRAANALYEATGFELVDVNWMWKKAL